MSKATATKPTTEALVDKLMESVKLDKVKVSLVRIALKNAGLEVSGTAEAVVRRLLAHQVETDPNNVLQCDVCGASSMESYEDCPFCNSEDGTPDAVPAPPEKEAKPAKARKEKKPAPVKDKPTKATKEKPAKKPTTAPPKPGGKGTALVKQEAVGDGSDAVVLTVKQLDAEIAAIKKAEERGTSSLFEIGHRMLRIRSGGLHTLRVDKKTGKPLYKKWEDFCQAELNMTRVHAQRLMNVVDGFKEEEVELIGPTKLSLIVGVKPGENREQLLDMARKGATRSTIADEVKRLTEAGKLERRHSGATSKATEAASEAKRRRAPDKSDPITMATAEQEVTVPLMTPEGDQAVKLADGVTGQETTSNGIIITYTLRLVKGVGAMLEVTRKRAED